MALQDPLRSTLFLKFEQLLGTDEAAALMAQFPTYEISEVVTFDLLDMRLRETEQRLHTDMANLRGELKGDMANLRGELKGDMANLRGDLTGRMTNHEGEVRGELVRFRAEMSVKFAEVDGRFAALDARMAAMPAEMTRNFMIWAIPIMLTVFGLCGTALALFR